MPRNITIITLLLSIPLLLTAQEKWTTVRNGNDCNDLEDIYTSLTDLDLDTDDDVDDDSYSNAFELLSEMAVNKRNINDMTLEDFMEVPLLTEQIAKAILNYRALYGDIKSMAELTLIPAIDTDHRRLLKVLFYADATKKDMTTNALGSLFDYGKHTLMATLKVPLNKRKGYETNISDGGYHGSNIAHTIRYHFQTRHLMAALTASQDAGEPFFSGTNAKGWDFYTGYVRMKDVGILKNIIAGDFQASTGMGLLLAGNFRPSRTTLLTGSPSSLFSFRGHSSKSVTNFMRGAAVTIVPAKHLTVSAFLSSRKIDATLNSDATIRTILTSGYHRTDSEIARRNSATQTVVGGNITFSCLPQFPLRFGLNIVHVELSDSLIPSMAAKYNWYKPRGKSFNSGSLTYSFLSPRLSIEGETAICSDATTIDSTTINSENQENSSRLSLATCNTIRWKASESWTLFALQRFYSYRFQSLLGRSFGDVSTTQNESGIYVGAVSSALKNVTIYAYCDYAYHPWYRYGHAAESSSLDAYIYGEYEKNDWYVSMRYHYREYINDRRTYADGTSTPLHCQHTARLKAKYSEAHWWNMAQLQGTSSGSDHGWLISDAIGWKKGFSLALQLTYFDTSDWLTRLYLQQPTVTYGASMVSLYGRGVRGTIVGSIGIAKRISLSALFSMNHFFDRSTISSGMQEITGSSQSDLLLQCMVKI